MLTVEEVHPVRLSAARRTRETIGQQWELSNDGGACAVVYLFQRDSLSLIRVVYCSLAGNKWKDARQLLGSRVLGDVK